MMSQDEQNSKETEDCSEWSLEEELQKNDKLRKEDVDALRKFISTLPKVDISSVTDNLVVALLHSSDYDLDTAKTTSASFFDLRLCDIPEIFTNRDLEDDDIKTALEVGYYCPLPRKTKEGYRIIFQGIRQTDVSLYNHVAITKVQTLTLDACVHEDPTCSGYIFIGDTNGVSMGHMWKSNLSITKKLMKFSQEGSPVKIHQMHLINTSSFTHYIMRMLKPFLSKHIYELFQLHTPDQLEEVYEHVPREYLPKDYGGELPEIDEIQRGLVGWLREMRPKVEILTKT